MTTSTALIKSLTSKREILTVDLLAASVKPGETRRDVCPWCNGGDSKEVSFVITRTEKSNVHYKCFRAKCGYKGKLFSNTWEAETEREAYGKRANVFTRAMDLLTPEQNEFFKREFDITNPIDVYYCSSIESYAFKVCGPKGETRGWTTKRFSPRLDLHYPNNKDEPFLDWRIPDVNSREVIVVEDATSAIKVAECGYNVVALLGTTINWDRAYEIAEHASKVNLALDKGTMFKMLDYRDKYGPVWGETVVWSLDKDLKYVGHERIKRAVENGEVDFRSYV